VGAGDEQTGGTCSKRSYKAAVEIKKRPKRKRTSKTEGKQARGKRQAEVGAGDELDAVWLL
jgi:hypothetical protein